MSSDFFLSSGFCLHNGVLITEKAEKKVTVGITEAADESLKKRILRAAEYKGFECSFEKLSGEEYSRQIGSLFSRKKEDESKAFLEEKKDSDENEAKALLESLIQRAVKKDATDIHIDKGEVRMRIMGSLLSDMFLEEKSEKALIARIKLLAKMNLLENSLCQDGQFIYEKNERQIFIRVSCVPCITGSSSEAGESVVLRLLNPERMALKLEKLGFKKEQLEKLEKLCELKDGLILVCGPTGSGKSTTASALLEEINCKCAGKKKIISLEDPVEYVLRNVTQVKIQEELKRDFNSVLKMILRQDPDVIMIGEIRDRESSDCAFKASLTGHLVIATMHTGSLEQTYLRLENFGIERNACSEVLKAVIIQRLEKGKLSAEVFVNE